MMTSKGQGLSLNTIIIAAVVLIVLVVLVGVFTGYFGNFLPEFMGASERVCEPENIKSECDVDTERQIFGNFNPPLEPGQNCCVVTRDGPEFIHLGDIGQPPSIPE